MKTILLILLALTISSVNLKAESLQGKAKLDSLLAELPNAKGDTNEVKLLSAISGSYYTTNPDKGIEYGELGFALAKKIDWKRGEAESYNSMGASYYSKSDYPKALEYYGKAIKINKELGDKNGISSNLTNIGAVYMNQSNLPKALEYMQKALKIDIELGNKAGVATILGNMGLVYQYQSDYLKALEYFEKALKIDEELGNKSGMAANLGNMGSVYEGQSDYPKALEYWGKALKINEEIGNKSWLANNLGNMGIIYMRLSDYPKTLEYYGKALKINEELGNKRGVAGNLSNMGNVYMNQSDYPKALKFYSKALTINEEIGNKSWLANNLVGMGNAFKYQSDYPKALEYYKKALTINEELGNKEGIAITIGNMGELYLTLSQDSVNIDPDELNQYIGLNKDINLNRSIEYSLQAIKIGKEIGELHYRSNNLKNLADAYKQKGEHEKRADALEEHHKLKDSVFNQENSDKIAALEKAREDDLKQKEIEKQKILIAEQEKREQLILYFLISLVLIMTVVMIVIYRLLKRSDKLLYNVLPVSIAKRLKKKEHPISDYFTQASIVFIDIVNFTEMAQKSDPQGLVSDLNKIFTKYDTISNKYGLEKIKTIGDSYMAAAGIPEVQKDNTHRAAQMALEVKAMMEDYHTADGTKIEVRIGLDCGPVVAGVIGENKFIYDMWSDAVNTASRMESSSIAGEVHVSERFKDAVTEYEEFEYVERGEIEIKGKGKMKTFFMGSKKLEV